MVATPASQRGHDAGLAMAVRGDHPVGQPGHLDDRPQFGVGELLVDGMVDFGQHTARGADLDHGRAPAQLLADRAQHSDGPSASRNVPS